MILRLLLLSIALGLAGCGGEPLDYDTAMNVMRERTSDPVRTSFSAVPHFDNQDARLSQAYQRLMDDHVILCKKSADIGTICQPGPAGDALTENGVSELSLVAGRWVPASIVAIQRTGRNTAIVQVRMTFEPSQIFQDYQNAFEQIQAAGGKLALDAGWRQGKTVEVTFQHYGDGWHVESVE